MTEDAKVELPGQGADKATWRAWANTHREDLPWDELSSLVTTSLLGHERLRAAKTVLLYMPLNNEIDLTSLIESEMSCQWLTTRTPEGGGLLTIHPIDGRMETHPYGFSQPHESAPEVHPFDVDVYLVPGLLFDLWGNRLGRGAGYYDRLLAIARVDSPLVGVVPTALVVDRLPVKIHDIPMTHLATEQGVTPTATNVGT